MEESAEEVLARLERYVSSLRHPPPPLARHWTAATIVVDSRTATSPMSTADTLVPSRSRVPRLWPRLVMQTAPLLLGMSSCLLAILVFERLAAAVAVVIAGALAVAGVIGYLRGVPFAGSWTIGLLVAGLLLRISSQLPASKRWTPRGHQVRVTFGLDGMVAVVDARGPGVHAKALGTSAARLLRILPVISLLAFGMNATAFVGAAQASSPAITYVGRVASAAVSSSGRVTSATLTVGAGGAQQGDAIVIALLLSSTNSLTGPVTVTDTAGNAYRVDRDVNDGSSKDRVLTISAMSVHALAAGATIRLSFPGALHYHVSADEFAGISRLDQATSASASSTTWNSGSATTTQPIELLFGVVGNESGAAPTYSSGWTVLPMLTLGKDHLDSGYQITNASGGYAASGSTGGTWMAALTTYVATTPDAPPVAALSVTPSSGTAPLGVTADASASTDTDATPIATYQFDFGDGTIVGPQAGATATHTYTTAGNYTVTVTVTDTGGLSNTTSKTVNVDTLVAALSVTPSSGAAPLAVTADASASTDTDGTPIATYQFDFGDGTIVGPQAGATATHTYTTAGNYTPTVTVTDTGGTSRSASNATPIAVDAPPVAALSVTPSSGTAPLGVTADASASTDTDATPIATYQFDFGDGTIVGPQAGATEPIPTRLPGTTP